MEKTSGEARIQELGESVSGLCGAFSDLPSYEIGVRLIAHATSMMLSCAPNHLIAMKTIMVSVEMGIAEFQEQSK